jgi:hypothetical protein
MSASARRYRKRQTARQKNEPPRPPHRPTPARVIGRAAFFIVAVILVISSTPAIAGLEEPVFLAEPPPTTTTTTTAGPNAQLVRLEVAPATAECDPLGLVPCQDDVTPAPIVDSDVATACSLGSDNNPSGQLIVVAGASDDIDAADVLRFRVEVEEGLAVDHACFAEAVLSILTDDRGWTSNDAVDFVRVDDDTYDFRLVLASPEATDSLCYPARTAGRYSCRNGEKVIINLMRWTSGTDDYTDSLTTYRQYLLNHEVGHFLGKGHLRCQATGELAPVMMQQTKGLGECLPNGWPTEVER